MGLLTGCTSGPISTQGTCGFFISIFFISVFYKNIFSIWKFTEIYPAAQLPGGRDLAARQPGGRGFSAKKNTKNNCRQVPGTGRPAAGRPAPPGRPAAGRPALPPYIRVGWSPTPHLHHYNSRNQEKREPATACNQNSSTLYK